jgi:UDP:flavonoid glycosyltransferase YjiC (YdhE family)
VIPLFWDQHDNAQRIAELGLGKRLPTYDWEPEDLRGAVEELLGDAPLRSRLTAGSTRIQAADGRTRAANLIDRLACT